MKRLTSAIVWQGNSALTRDIAADGGGEGWSDGGRLDVSDIAARAYRVIVESDPDARDGHAELLQELRALAQRAGRLTGSY